MPTPNRVTITVSNAALDFVVTTRKLPFELAFPDMCCYCCGPKEVTKPHLITNETTNTVGTTRSTMTYTKMVEIPYCHAHYDVQHDFRRKILRPVAILCPIVGLFVGIVSGFLLPAGSVQFANSVLCGWILLIVIPTVIGMALGVALMRLIVSVLAGSNPSFDWLKDYNISDYLLGCHAVIHNIFSISLEFSNERYARAFAELNQNVGPFESKIKTQFDSKLSEPATSQPN